MDIPENIFSFILFTTGCHFDRQGEICLRCWVRFLVTRVPRNDILLGSLKMTNRAETPTLRFRITSISPFYA
jgi:uncharacterized Fe-S cluster-containing MiaB family protein